MRSSYGDLYATITVPIMDLDNTATGNGDKDALPQDHNRD